MRKCDSGRNQASVADLLAFVNPSGTSGRKRCSRFCSVLPNRSSR